MAVREREKEWEGSELIGGLKWWSLMDWLGEVVSGVYFKFDMYGV